MTKQRIELSLIISQIRASGCTSLRAIAAQLNTREIEAPWGGHWSAIQLQRVLNGAFQTSGFIPPVFTQSDGDKSLLTSVSRMESGAMSGEIIRGDGQPVNNQAQGTRMESFAPLAGSVVVLGYDQVGEVAGVSLQVRELMDDKGGLARGALLTVKQDQHHVQNAFIDADEIPELLKGFDALLSVSTNPTQFGFFEVKYKTRGNMELLVFNNRNGLISYAVKAGRGTVAQVFNCQNEHIRRLKNLFEFALEKLDSLPSTIPAVSR